MALLGERAEASIAYIIELSDRTFVVFHQEDNYVPGRYWLASLLMECSVCWSHQVFWGCGKLLPRLAFEAWLHPTLTSTVVDMTYVYQGKVYTRLRNTSLGTILSSCGFRKGDCALIEV